MCVSEVKVATTMNNAIPNMPRVNIFLRSQNGVVQMAPLV
jgi:hypothetical protein